MSSPQVDKHIRRLDADLARFEADLKDKMEGSDFESPGGRGLKSKSASSSLFSLLLAVGMWGLGSRDRPCRGAALFGPAGLGG